jgi:predicted Holliday junction resolvase-like endonuclease
MKRFRLGTLMLVVVIAALGLGMILQELRHLRREARLEAENTQMREWIARERSSKMSITAINEEQIAYREKKKKEATSASKDANH